MRPFLLFMFFFIVTTSIHAQIDNRKKSVAIPAVESKKDSSETKTLLPSKPINSNSANISSINIPKTSTELNVPKKEFSMFPKEEFGNPGELYQKSVDRQTKAIKEQLELGTKGSKEDVFYGDFKTKSKFIVVQYRDYGQIDGDIIRVSVNDAIMEYRVGLTGNFNGFKIELKPGYNKIDFLALNEGYLLPNTAHFRILGDQGEVIAMDMWALSVDVKATINIVKE